MKGKKISGLFSELFKRPKCLVVVGIQAPGLRGSHTKNMKNIHQISVRVSCAKALGLKVRVIRSSGSMHAKSNPPLPSAVNQ